MKSILNHYTPLNPYFKRLAIGRVDKSKRPFFEALKLYDVDHSIYYLKNTDASKIERYSQEIFSQLAKEISAIPAYQRFIAEKQTLVDKENYLNKYSLDTLLPKPVFGNLKFISVSSGSSGKPYFWPRGNYLELETTIIYEMILKDIFEIDKYKTLVIDAYSMGMYVAGVFTLNSCLRIAQRGYDLSVITPGISLENILRIVTEIGKYYEQIVICGYPPFVKDTIEEGIRQGIDWKDFKLRFIFGAEAISEEWRDYLFEKAKITDRYRSSVNTYGSADAAILGHETPISILIKKIAQKNPGVFEKLFNNRSVSTFIQYHPHLKYFETVNDELILSTAGGMPLLRYNLHDSGKIYKFDEMVKFLQDEGVDILDEAKKLGLSVWRLPFIVLFGKSDHTITLYGLNIYPQTVRSALEDSSLIDKITTRMTMSTRYDAEEDQYIEIQVELKENVTGNEALRGLVLEKVFANLLKYNYEYRTLVEKIGEKRARPKIVLVEHGTITNDRGSKQKWIS